MDENYYDFLTSLPTMTYFFEISSARKETIKKNNGTPALLFLTLCGFKSFNQKFGFPEGNKFIKSFSELLSKYFNKENCSRLGGVHFAIIADEQKIKQNIQNIFQEFNTLHTEIGDILYPHIGIYLYTTEDVNINVACDRAKLACDALKDNHFASYNYYDQKIKHAEENHRYIIENFSKAISERWITVYYQPIVRAINGRVCDEEALARWIDPVKGFLSPADFIPVLEEEKLIYKLDLYILERVIEKMKYLESQGYQVLPQSINLSRSDFESCDIVEEIRTRIDIAGIPREKLSIEITESVVGSDFDFMLKQIQKFRDLGFPVWMDDFGSGYSSLNVLKEIPFTLIKFDMSFMRQFDQKNNGKLILTELMKMAFSIGADTICEGVETEEQIQFLKEIGCSKIQGYYFGKPIPFEEVLSRIEDANSLGYENLLEEQYHNTVARLNLHDISSITYGNEHEFNNLFNTVPMAIVELKENSIRFARTNLSYRNFFLRFFGFPVNDSFIPFTKIMQSSGSNFLHSVLQVADDGKNCFVDEILPDGSIANYFIRYLTRNPVTSDIAVAVGVLAIKDAALGATYENIAKALSADYFNIYYVNLETEDFTEFSSTLEEESLTTERHGTNFFEQIASDIKKTVYSEDQNLVLTNFTKEIILKTLEKDNKFSLTYRRINKEKPFYVNMKLVRMPNTLNSIVIAINNVDAQIKQKKLLDKAQEEQVIYTRLMSLSGDFIGMYIVDLENEKYTEYSASKDFEEFGLEKQGTNFFENTHKNAEHTLHPDDLQTFKENFTREKIIEAIKKRGVFTTQYHLMLNGEKHPASTRAALVKENGRDMLIIGIRA